MSISFPGTITGAAQTGFTSPTYTTTLDQAPGVNAKQVAITALGGTQAGVVVHSVSSPFTLAFWKPLVYALLGKPNPLTGLIQTIPMNKHKLIVRKGVTPAAGQPARVMVCRIELDVPAGAETYDIANVRACLSAAFGSAYSMSSGIGDTVNNGVM